MATQVAIDTQSPSTGANNWLSAQIGLVLCRLLDRTPSERSEASWSFNISIPWGSGIRDQAASQMLMPDDGLLMPAMGIDDESDQVP